MDSIDINSDLGEFRNEKQLTNELNILNYISSCSIACGGHVGDVNSIKTIIEACKKHSIAIGPHPSYPDKEGFGRRMIDIESKDLENSIRDQINLFLKVADSLSMPVRHVKLHGRLYNEVSKSEVLSSLFVNLIDSFKYDLSVIGPAESLLGQMLEDKDIPFIPEAFIDRTYKEDLTLVDRSEEGSVLISVEEQINQARSIVCDEKIMSNNNKILNLKAETLCIHGDSPNSLEVAEALTNMLIKEKIKIQSN
ncbi:MAG: LamB/YcsF family protein [SAR86 cluster bacterium]